MKEFHSREELEAKIKEKAGFDPATILVSYVKETYFPNLTDEQYAETLGKLLREHGEKMLKKLVDKRINSMSIWE